MTNKKRFLKPIPGSRGIPLRSMGTPSGRKPPVRHRVTSHTRKRKRISSYMRGNGPPVVKTRKTRIHNSSFNQLVKKEMREHPWLTRAQAEKIVKDHMKKEYKTFGELKIKVPHGTKVTIERKKKNPAEVDITPLRSPITGAPMEPAMEYGKSIVYDPYAGDYHYVTPKGETTRVTPTFTRFHRKALAMTEPHLEKAVKALQNPSDLSTEKLEQAINHLRSASELRFGIRQYHHLGFEKDPVVQEIGNAIQYSSLMLMNAKATKSEADKQYYLEQGATRIKASLDAVKTGLGAGKE